MVCEAFFRGFGLNKGNKAVRAFEGDIHRAFGFTAYAVFIEDLLSGRIPAQVPQDGRDDLKLGILLVFGVGNGAYRFKGLSERHDVLPRRLSFSQSNGAVASGGLSYPVL